MYRSVGNKCSVMVFFFFFKQKTAYEIGTGDWSSDVCSSDLQISFEIWNRWNMGLQTVANQLLNMEPLEYGVSNSCKSVSNHGTVGTWGCKQLQISF